MFKKFSFRNEFLETLCKHTPPDGRNAEKLKYGAASLLQGQVFLKEAGLEPFLFNFFKVYHFYI